MKKTLRILIIEDSEGDTLFLVRRLERSGFTPIWKRVDSIESLRTALAEESWDIAFSDYSMPGLRIRDALALVKERGFLNGIRRQKPRSVSAALTFWGRRLPD